MAKKPLTREQKVFNKLAATGRYVSTGKVLIGLSYVPKLLPMSRDEERMQSFLLGSYRPFMSGRAMVYTTVVLVVLASLFVACSP